MVNNKKHVFSTALLALFLFLLPLLVSGQWLETTIHVPDSLCGIRHPKAFTYNETGNTIYVGGWPGNNVIAVDGNTHEKVAKIPSGEDINYLCWNSIHNKVYCANGLSDDVTVIDGVTNTVITTIAVGNNPCALIYNPTNNNVYCADAGSHSVTVIDGATNGVVTTIAVQDMPWAFAWNPIQNRIYVANRFESSVSVIRDVIGVKENITSTAENNSNDVVASIFSGPLALPESRKCRIFDIMGRVADPDKIQPGVYFIEIDGVIVQKIVKVR
jgi:YVTN family beta-propeller protein